MVSLQKLTLFLCSLGPTPTRHANRDQEEYDIFKIKYEEAGHDIENVEKIGHRKGPSVSK